MKEKKRNENSISGFIMRIILDGEYNGYGLRKISSDITEFLSENNLLRDLSGMDFGKLRTAAMRKIKRI